MKVIDYVEKLDSDNLYIHILSDEIMYKEVEKPVLIMSHVLTRTGAPIQLLYLIKALISLGYCPFVFSAEGGDYLDEILETNVVVIVTNGKSVSCLWLDIIPNLFDIVFANTTCVLPFVNYLAPKVPQLYWWIHENSWFYTASDFHYYVDVPSLHYVAASLKTNRHLIQYVKSDNDILNVCIDDKGYIDNANNSRKSFLWAATLDSNKAVDVFLNAILKLPIDILLKADYYIVAKNGVSGNFSMLIEEIAKKLPNVHFLRKLSHDELMNFMDTVDAVVVSSIEETTSMVAVEGLMKKKVVICSDGCGVTDYLENQKSALIFPSRNYEKLSEMLRLVIENYDSLEDLRTAGREVYEKIYMFDSFVNNLKKLLHSSTIINSDMNKCSGCGACVLSCPVNAIEMKVKKGFKYPVVNEEKCIDCGKCKSVCQVNSVNNIKDEPSIYAYRMDDENKRLNSQSGGAFTALAEEFINNGGVVFGVELSTDNEARYCKITNVNELVKLKGSKYVQADTYNIYAKVKESLLEGSKVLFSGTSCHIDGLYHYLQGMNIDNLYTIDLICHGVPSPDVFKKYIDYLSSNGKKITNYNFRNKKLSGWRETIESWNEENTIKISNEYANIFYSKLSLRESCYKCSYATFNKPSDITIGDFWGVEKVLPLLDDNKGVSLVMARTDKGKELVNKIEITGILRSVKKNECIQPNLKGPTGRPTFTDYFWSGFYERPFRSLYSSFVIGSVLDFNSNILLKLCNDCTLYQMVSDYERIHYLNVDAICGNWKIIEKYLNMFSDDLIKPQIIDTFETGRNFVEFSTVKLSEYADNFNIKNENNIKNVILILEIDGTSAFTDTLIEKGIPAENILPISFVVDDEV